LIDDETALLDLSKQFLELDQAISVDTVSSALEALELIKAHEYDIAVSDYQMPGKNGIQLLRELRAEGNRIPFILFTGKGREDVAIDALNAGADFYLQKGGDPRAQFAELANIIWKSAEKHRMELDLIKNEEKFKNIFNSANDSIHILDLNGQIIEINEIGCDWLGYTKQEMLQKNVTDLDSEQYAGQVLDRMDEVMQKGFALFESEWVSKGGRIIPVEISARRIDFAGRPSILSVARNVSERRRSEELLIENESKFSTMADFTYDWEYWAAPEGRIIYCSPSCERITGYSPRELSDDPDLLIKMVHPEDRTIFTNHLEEEGEKPVELEYRIFARNGEVRWISHVCQPVFDETGRNLGRRVSNRDITDRKGYEETLINDDKRITSLNRMLAMLSQTNQMLVRTKNLEEMCSRICEIAIQHGRFEHAWIGNMDQGSVAVLASASKTEEGFLPRTKEVIQAEELALSTASYICIARLPGQARNGAAADPLAAGIPGSVLILPIKRRGEPQAFLGIHAAEEDFFSKEENAVLEEMVMDVSFGWDSLLEEDDRERAENDLVIQHRIAQIFLTRSDEEMYDSVLRVVLDLLRSPFGVFGYLDEAGAHVVPTMTRQVWDKCQVSDKTFRFPPETWGHSSWVRAYREKRPNYSNMASTKTPEGHISITRHISMPILFRGEAIGLFQVANKESDYSRRDIRTLEKIAEYVAPLLDARLRHERMEKALRESEERTRNILDQAGDGIIMHDRTGHIIDVNKKLCLSLGYTREELLSMSIEDVDPDAIQAGKGNLWESVLAGETLIFESRHIRKDGSAIPVELTLGLVQSPSGSAILGIVRNITERKRMEESLLQKTREVDGFFSNSLDLLAIADTDGYFRRMNKEWESVLGYPLSELEGQKFLDQVHPDDLEATIVRVSDLSNAENLLDFTNRYRCKDGSYRWIKWRSFSAGTIIYASARDVTESKLAEDAMKGCNRKLNLLSSITRHDIKNQLMALDANLTLLRMKDLDPASEELLRRSGFAISKISAMIQFTKEYEDVGVNAPTWQNVRALVEQEAEGVELGPVMLVNDVPSNMEVFADPLIVKVFRNLIDNAVRHGGHITTIRFHAEAHDDVHTVICADDGIGIPPDIKMELFTHGSMKGHGFGLFLSREILAITGITLTEKGEAGRGAKLVMTVPSEGLRMTN